MWVATMTSRDGGEIKKWELRADNIDWLVYLVSDADLSKVLEIHIHEEEI
jgi:hypothetical protein